METLDIKNDMLLLLALANSYLVICLHFTVHAIRAKIVHGVIMDYVGIDSV